MPDVEKDSTLMDSASTETSEIEAVPGGSSEEKRVGAGRSSYSPQLDIVELREQLLAEREANLAHVRALSARYVELQASWTPPITADFPRLEGDAVI